MGWWDMEEGLWGTSQTQHPGEHMDIFTGADSQPIDCLERQRQDQSGACRDRDRPEHLIWRQPPHTDQLALCPGQRNGLYSPK